MANAVLAATGILAESGGGFSVLTKGMTNLMSLMTAMLTGITANDILATFFVAGFGFTLISLLKALKA